MAADRSPFHAPLSAAVDHALEYLSPQAPHPVAATASLQELRSRLALSLPEFGTDSKQVIDQLASAVEAGLVNTPGPRFFGWVIGGSLPSALAADWLTSTWDQNAGLYACSPAAAVVEEVVGGWLKQLLPVHPKASFALVTGAQMAHATCLAAARNALLARRGIDVEAHGLAGAPALRILGSTAMHGTVDRAVRLLGIGTSNIVRLAADESGRLLADALQVELARDPEAPTVVVLQAGDLNTGAFDDFTTLIPIAQRANAWVHIDGAFGLWANVSARCKPMLDHCETADSWTTDGHKWLNVPYDCGYAFVKDREAHRAAMQYHAAYLVYDKDARDQLDWNPEHSRRARGFATYAAIRELGRQGIGEIVDRCCECARALATGIGSLDGAELVWEPTLNQGLVRFLAPGRERTEQDNDAFTDLMREEIAASGEAFFTNSTWRGKRVMRISVCNWQTTQQEIEAVVACVDRLLRQHDQGASER